MSRIPAFVSGAVASLMLLVLSVSPPAFGAFHLEYEKGAKRVDFVGQPGSLTDAATADLRRPESLNPSAGISENPESRRTANDQVRWGQGWGSVQARIAAAWPGDDRKALAVVACETGRTFNPSIKNPSGKYKGLWQADSDFSQTYAGVSDASTLSVEEQTAMAWKGYQARGWAPWECA